jgi:hypothetical protein
MSRKKETKIEMLDGTTYVVTGGQRHSDVIRGFSVYVESLGQNGHRPKRQLLLPSALVERDSYTGWILGPALACKLPANHERQFKDHLTSKNGLHT